ncbi:MAG: DUF3891 family protein [Thermoanaerobaculaceae bacterium]
MIVRPSADGFLLIPQSAHALVAFAMARNWGNHLAPRPGPVDEVLAAVLLHDAGWDEGGREPALAPDGSLANFSTWPQGAEREALWWDSFQKAQSRGRYVAYLVGCHVLHLAETYAPGAHNEFTGKMRRELAALSHSLATDPRYGQVLRTGQDQVNQNILRLCDAAAVKLCQGVYQPVVLGEAPFKGGPSPLKLQPTRPHGFHLHPWPFRGRHLALTVEACLLSHPLPTTQEELIRRYRKAPRQRLTFHLYPLGTAPV